MFNSDKSPIQLEINKYRSAVNIQLRKLKEDLDNLVYWETLYNKENKINKNSENLDNLIVINKLLKEKTPEYYFIEQKKEFFISKKEPIREKIENIERVEIVLPSSDVLETIYNLSHTKKEIFLLKNNIPGSPQRTIIKIERNGKYEFLLKTKHKNIEDERIIDAAEYLMLTTQIDVNIDRISTTNYTFIYKNHRYNIYINNTESTAILEYYKSSSIPDFLKIKI